ncbi:unnamed protein product, partial [Effrenium voratum]
MNQIQYVGYGAGAWDREEVTTYKGYRCRFIWVSLLLDAIPSDVQLPPPPGCVPAALGLFLALLVGGHGPGPQRPPAADPRLQPGPRQLEAALEQGEAGLLLQFAERRMHSAGRHRRRDPSGPADALRHPSPPHPRAGATTGASAREARWLRGLAAPVEHQAAALLLLPREACLPGEGGHARPLHHGDEGEDGAENHPNGEAQRQARGGAKVRAGP